MNLHSLDQRVFAAEQPETPVRQQQNGSALTSSAASTIHPVDAAAQRFEAHELAQRFIRESISEGEKR